MSEYKIEKDVPTPPANRSKYPWRKMAVGDSFFAPAALQRVIGSNASRVGKKLGRKYVTRVMTENGIEGVRVWRVE